MPSTETSAVGDPSSSQPGNSNNSTAGNPSSSQTGNSNNSTADNPSSSHIRGIWLRARDVAELNVTNLRNANITDVFVNTPHTVPSSGILNYRGILDSVIARLNNTGIRIHPWILAFRASGIWFDPQGRYSYQVQVPYTVEVRVPHRVRVRTWHRVRFFSRGRWRTRWVARWTFRDSDRITHQTRHRQETRFDYNRTRTNNLLNSISNLTREFSGRIHGIHLDYIRYRGVGDSAAYRHDGTEVITGFVREVYSRVNAINNSLKLSAAVMPEPMAYTVRYYGENVTMLSRYLDFLVPMVYRGNFREDREWITSSIKRIIRHSNGTPVVAGLLTYGSDLNVTQKPADELNNDIRAAWKGGSSGFVLFRYGLINSFDLVTHEELLKIPRVNPGNPPVNPSNSPTTSNPGNSPVNPGNPSVTGPRWYQQYLHLRETRNAQVNHPEIRSLAASLISGATSVRDRATRLFYWVRNNIPHSFYRNTRYGAVGTLNRRRGNCVDQSHLLVALSRAAGIPARYMHGLCTFIPSGNTFGHVWVQMWVNGRWHNTDTTSRRNNFGVIRNWCTRTVVMRGTHSSLPF
ncbi:MAG: transglutaminase domain-containing protein [Methanobacteriaceae archaeon]